MDGIRIDKPREECGVFGIYSTDEALQAAHFTYLGLYALQHRGQESCGIAVGDGNTIRLHKGMGLVSEVFGGEQPGFAWSSCCGPCPLLHYSR